MINHQIKKVGGEVEVFSISKLRRSIINAGAKEVEADKIIIEIADKVDEIKSTTDVHQYVFDRLVVSKPHVAARYSLKKSLHTLGPTGYPFEQYIASIYRYMGYKTTVGEILKGACVNHEIDVIARTDNDILYIECKYHQSQSAKSNVKIPLYVKARTDDIFDHQSLVENNNMKFSFFIATNTRFTEDAAYYSKCKNINLLSWVQPESDPLPKIIDRYGLHPVTALPSLTKNQAKRLIELGVVLVRDIPDSQPQIIHAGVSKDQVERVIKEADDVLSL